MAHKSFSYFNIPISLTQEKSSYDKKLSDFEWQLEGKDKEISAMNKTIETLQSRLDKETNKPNFRREELENAAQENRYLRSQVTDSQTAVALLRSELAELKSQFVEQADQLDKEQRTAQASMQEQENLARQLQLLYEANQRLQDINDELRGSLEERKTLSPERKTSCEVLKLSG
jgi:Ras and EF-hand domain-containing protein